MNKPFTGEEAANLAYLARYPSVGNVIINKLQGRAKEVALVLIGKKCVTEDTKSAVESLQKWVESLEKENERLRKEATTWSVLVGK